MNDESQLESKTCPWCAEEIRREAIKCRYCGSMVDPTARFRGWSDQWIRPLRGRSVAGVCAGLSRHFEVSVTLLRLAFILGFIFSGGLFLLIYVVLWLIMPNEENFAQREIEGP